MTTSAIDIVFRSVGIDAIRQAMAGVSGAMDSLAKRSATVAERAAKDQVRAHQGAAKAQKDLLKEVDRAVKESQKERERVERDRIRTLNVINNMEVREWQQKEREKTRTLEQEERRRQALIRTRAQMMGSIVTSAGSRVLGTAGRMAGVVGMLGGGFTLVDSLRSGIEEQKMAGQIVRSSASTGGLTSDSVQSAARAAAIATGTRTTEQLAGLDAMVQKTGDLKTAVDMLGDLAKMAAASGAKLEDLGSTAAEVFNAVGNAAESKDVLLTLIGQGKAGAVDIRNLGQYGARLTSTAGLFEGNVGTNIKEFGALAQIAKAKGGASDAAEATESAFRLFDEMATHREKFEALGVKVTGKGGLLRDPVQTMLDVLTKTGGDLTQIPGLYGRQGGKVAEGLAKAFLEGSAGRKDAGSLAAGRARATDLIAGFEKPTTMAEVEVDLKKKMLEVDSKLNVALENFEHAISNQLMPKLPQLIDALSQLIPYVAKAAEIFSDFPAASIVALMGLAFTKEIAGASIGLRVREEIASAIRQANGLNDPNRPPPTGTDPGSSPGGMLGRLLPAAGFISEATRDVQKAVGSTYSKELLGNINRADVLAQKIQAGTATEAERQEANGLGGYLGRRAAGGKSFAVEDYVTNLGRDVAATFTGGQDQREQDRAAASSIAIIEAAAKRLDTALGKVEATAGDAAGNLSKVSSAPSPRAVEPSPHWPNGT
jgi:hypothetical protein